MWFCVNFGFILCNSDFDFILYYNLILCFIPLEMHVRLLCAIKFYLLTYLLTYRAFCCTSFCLSVSALKQEAQLPQRDRARTLGHLKSCQLLLNCTKKPLKIAVGEWPSRTFKVDWYRRQSIAIGHTLRPGWWRAVTWSPWSWWNLAWWRTSHIGPYSGLTFNISNFSKSKMAAAAILKITKNRNISATVWPIFTKFGMLLQNGSLNHADH